MSYPSPEVALVVIAPSHLAGSMVVCKRRCDLLDEDEYQIDRLHPEGGGISISVDDCRVIEIARDRVHRFRKELGPAPETADIDYALAVMDLPS